MSTDITNTQINWKTMENLKSLLKEKFPLLLETFLKNTQDEIQQIRNDLQSGQFVHAKFIAHRLGSGAAQFGLLKVSQSARALELEPADDQDILFNHYKSLETEFEAVLPLLQEKRNTDG